MNPRLVLERFLSHPPHPAVEPPYLASLTDREREVLLQLGQGHTNAEIGRNLYIGEATVNTQVARTLAKLSSRG